MFHDDDVFYLHARLHPYALFHLFLTLTATRTHGLTSTITLILILTFILIVALTRPHLYPKVILTVVWLMVQQTSSSIRSSALLRIPILTTSLPETACLILMVTVV